MTGLEETPLDTASIAIAPMLDDGGELFIECGGYFEVSCECAIIESDGLIGGCFGGFTRE